MEHRTGFLSSGLLNIRACNHDRVSAVHPQKAELHDVTTNRCNEIRKWDPIPSEDITEEYGEHIYDKAEGPNRQRVDIEKLPLHDENKKEIHVFDSEGMRINRTEADENTAEPCGVMMDLENIQALFSPGAPTLLYDGSDDDYATPEALPTKVEVYPLGFLRTVGNLQATGPPHCLHPTLKKINKSVCEPPKRRSRGSDSSFLPEEEDNTSGRGTAQAVKATASQFYNLVAHRAASRAGRMDSQQGLVTAALSGGFARTAKDKRTALNKKTACDAALPSERFHNRIHLPECPKSCRAEVVYTVDVRKLKEKSGR